LLLFGGGVALFFLDAFDAVDGGENVAGL